VTKSLSLSIIAGIAIGSLAWIDPVFIPLVLAGPLITGAICGARSVALRWVNTAWAIAGISMLVSDWIRNNEDQVFHAALTAIMVALASIGWVAGTRLGRRRSTSTPAASKN
jgi:hypothetical protein